VSQAVIDAAADHESAKWTFYDTIVLRGMKEPTACWTDSDTSGSHPERTATHTDRLDGGDLPPDTNPVIDIHTAEPAPDDTEVPDTELDAPPRR
jgi:adenylate cyclase